MTKEQLLATGASFVIMMVAQAIITIRQLSKKIDDGDKDLHKRINQLDKEKITRDDLDREISSITLVLNNEILSIKTGLGDLKNDIKTDNKELKTQYATLSNQISSRLDIISDALLNNH